MAAALAASPAARPRTARRWRRRWLGGVLFWALLAAAVGRPAGAATTDLANGIMVIVNDAVITYKDVYQYIQPTVALLTRQYADQPAVMEQRIQDAKRDGIEQLVERKLILHEFKTGNYRLPESIIEDRVRERIRERFGDRWRMTKSLEEEGITFETFRQRIREDFILAVMRSHNISQEIIISPHKLEKYYAEHRDQFKVEDEVELRRIVLNKPAGEESGATRKLADEILAKLDEGAPFAEMAAVYSEGSDRAQGGYWGWQERTAIRTELAAAAFALKAGQRSGVIETKDACYILLVVNIRAYHVKTLPEVRTEIEKTLQDQERARLSKQWIERLKQKSFVRYF